MARRGPGAAAGPARPRRVPQAGAGGGQGERPTQPLRLGGLGARGGQGAGAARGRGMARGRKEMSIKQRLSWSGLGYSNLLRIEKNSPLKTRAPPRWPKGLNLTTLQWLHPLSIQVMVSITAGRPLGPGTLEKGWVRPKQAWVEI